LKIHVKEKYNPSELTSVSFSDSYSENCSAGRTVGTQTACGVIRKGLDVEKRIAIDNGALRLQPLVTPGWGRQGIVYGPYSRVNGLAFAVFLVNGHNTSEATNLGQRFVTRLLRWLRGSETESPAERLWRWIRSNRKLETMQLFRWWSHIPKSRQLPRVDENLAVGWFPREVPDNPLTEGNAFIVHATGPENGELWVRAGANPLSAFKGLQNLQIYYVVILREKGAAYYAASVPNAHGLVAYPRMRPLAIDAFNQEATVYAGFYQSVLGQIGFRVDTRVYAARVEQIPEFTTWYGTAQAADDLIGEGLLDGSEAEIGGSWTVYQGNYELTSTGVRSLAANSLAILNPSVPSGLLHSLVETPATVTGLRLLWRVQDENNLWSFLMDGDQCQLQIKEDGLWKTVAVSDALCLKPKSLNSVQILDDGETFSLYLNGQLVFDTWFTDTRLQTATGVGLGTVEANQDLFFRAFEAHPRDVPIPPELDLGSPWIVQGTQSVITENFEGTVRDLAGKTTSSGSQVWRREIGKGLIELTGKGAAKVRANAENPNPNRTAYTIAWENPDFADAQVDITPPGTERGQRENGRSGLIFWQDANNYIIINNWLDNDYGGASISSFFYINGYEEIYDAVWTNVGSRVYWGITHTLRVVFDGLNYTAFVNDEPVLYRALTDVYPKTSRLAINRVGIVANWEWGNDTGSLFNNFIIKV